MTNNIWLEIGDLESLMSFLTEAKRKTGLGKDIPLEKVKYAFRNTEFPMKIAVNLDGVIKIASNPILKKMFGKKIETTAIKYLNKAILAK